MSIQVLLLVIHLQRIYNFFIVPCYYIICFGCLMGFTKHFYIIFGTNVTQCKLLFFCLFQCFAEKEYQTESKWNETFGKRPQALGARSRGILHLGLSAPRGPSYPNSSTINSQIFPYVRGQTKKTFPPPQASVLVISHLGAFSSIPSEGDSITEGLCTNLAALPMMRE